MKAVKKDVSYYLDSTFNPQLVRSWNKSTRKWAVAGEPYTMWDSRKVSKFCLGNELISGAEMDPSVITMRFTGKVDSADARIYELDIVHGDFPYAKHGIVTWDPKRCSFYIDPFRLDGRTGGAQHTIKATKCQLAS